MLRQKSPDDKPATTLKKVAAIIRKEPYPAGKDETIEQLIRFGEDRAASLDPEERERWVVTLGEGALAAGKEDLALGLWERHVKTTASAPVLMRLGNVLAEKKRWPEAADRYKQAG